MYRVLGDVSPEVFQGVVRELKHKSLAVNNYRKNSGVGRSQCFGYVRQRNGTYTGSRQNYERIELYQELLQLASKILPPTFPWMSIQVNVNYQTAAHLDRGNKGDSAIVAFGEYTGGELICGGESVDIKNRVVLFDGSQVLHSTSPFTGTRYSLVFHTPDADFLEIPRFSFVIHDDDKLCLREDLAGLTRTYRKDGVCVFASDGIYAPRQRRKPTLRPCVENVKDTVE